MCCALYYLKCQCSPLDGVKGNVLLDIGHGPTIYQDLSACEVFKEIIGADYTDRNREYYEKSLRNEPGTFDWTDVIKTVCEMEGKGKTVEEKREKLRNTVTKTIKCDITRSKPTEPLVLPQVDCMMTIGCLESGCKDLDTYRYARRNISTLLKIGGHLIIIAILNCTSYQLGGERFSSLSLSEEFMKDAITKTGYTILDLEVIPREYNKEQYDLCNYDSILFVLARKDKDIE
uniref:Nicotinamide N-methyltransferase n=1 Tax=Leptobrachium leishanense TaxID=445787 RepID=A0A8C5PZL0_9ANUR